MSDTLKPALLAEPIVSHIAAEDSLAEAVRLTRMGREVGRVGLDHAYVNPIPPPRPTDEDIWREAFMIAAHDVDQDRTYFADAALAEYRKRWPR